MTLLRFPENGSGVSIHPNQHPLPSWTSFFKNVSHGIFFYKLFIFLQKQTKQQKATTKTSISAANKDSDALWGNGHQRWHGCECLLHVCGAGKHIPVSEHHSLDNLYLVCRPWPHHLTTSVHSILQPAHQCYFILTGNKSTIIPWRESIVSSRKAYITENYRLYICTYSIIIIIHVYIWVIYLYSLSTISKFVFSGFLIWL